MPLCPVACRRPWVVVGSVRAVVIVLCCVAAGLLEAVTGFRRVNGCKDMLTLVIVLRTLGFEKSSEMVAPS